MKLNFSDILDDQNGFAALIDLYAQAKDISFENVEIDMAKTKWFDADMCAAFGAVLSCISDNVNTIKLINIPSSVKEILAKNGFLSHYGHEKISDIWGTTIPYWRFDAKDDRYFSDYVENKLVKRDELPEMSLGLKKKFQESIFEIFSNAVLHSQTKLGIYSCGQFFPKRHQLNFSIADLGIGIRQNVKNMLSLDLSPAEAITWAISGNNTTKQDRIPGGLGLKLLTHFVDLNGGCIQIVSDAGYWKRDKGENITYEFDQAFPGTVVSIQINTADSTSYKLSSELTTADIF